MQAQGLITIRVLTHIVDIHRLDGSEGRIRLLDLRDEPRLAVLGNPLGEVMDAAGIAVDDSLPIAHGRKVSEVGLPSVLTAIGTLSEGSDGLYERCAVQLAGVDHEPLLTLRFERVGHIRHTQELTGKEQRDIRTGRLPAHLAEQPADGDAVSPLVDRLLNPSPRRHCQRQAHTHYHHQAPFHISFHFPLSSRKTKTSQEYDPSPS